MFRTIVSLAAALSLAAAITPAASAKGASQTDTVSQAVYMGDLNLESPEGAATLLGRIKRAANRVCDNIGGSRPLAMRRAAQRCASQAISDAVADLDLPVVTALYTGEPVIMTASR